MARGKHVTISEYDVSVVVFIETLWHHTPRISPDRLSTLPIKSDDLSPTRILLSTELQKHIDNKWGDASLLTSNLRMAGQIRNHRQAPLSISHRLDTARALLLGRILTSTDPSTIFQTFPAALPLRAHALVEVVLSQS